MRDGGRYGRKGEYRSRPVENPEGGLPKEILKSS